MNILITGGGGFLARGMILPLAEHGHRLRLMDVGSFETPHGRVVGSVADLDCVQEAMRGMDAVLIAHMAPRKPDAYATPALAFEINVTGTANLFFAAEAAGIRKIALISSTSVGTPQDAEAWRRTVPLPHAGIYGATKSCQEALAQHYARNNPDMQISVLRVGYILDGEAMQDKYGRVIGERAPLDTDRRDIGEVARLCLERDVPGLHVFPVMSTHEAMDEWGAKYTRDTLGWKPRYDFDRLPMPKNRSL